MFYANTAKWWIFLPLEIAWGLACFFFGYGRWLWFGVAFAIFFIYFAFELLRDKDGEGLFIHIVVSAFASLVGVDFLLNLP